MNQIEQDKQTIRLMIELYCRHHLHQDAPSREYVELINYACRRIDHCPFGVDKHACKDCPVHCYTPQMREKIRQVMRWSGPRMLFYSPRATLRHLQQIFKHQFRKK
ncbi:MULTISPECIES: nitrous oxide-stimulated promoter family protein [unclassified Prevotella]|uniref:nitrous oxide-stimulated promoter family protein n=1 Tax=unclassified Prevotella TaxID=2638335 RepID=UPI00051420D7|nr:MULTISPECIES: nitrous oxide-stimulated promoter family protein [unclassified Prevotella]KGI61289.1 nitrous oxide regulator [Prevotella sp. S7 MS 2]